MTAFRACNILCRKHRKKAIPVTENELVALEDVIMEEMDENGDRDVQLEEEGQVEGVVRTTNIGLVALAVVRL